MTVKEVILLELKDKFPAPKKTLNSTSNFQFLIAAILSSVSTDVQTNKTIKKLFQGVITPQDILELGLSEIEKRLKNQGLGQVKAKYVFQTSEILVKLGYIPETRSELMKLPGVGGKVSAVYLSQICNKNYFAVDTHCKRLCLRWGITKSQNPDIIEKDVGNYFKGEDLSKLHLRMVLYGREYCKATKKDCSCQICLKLR